MHPLRSAGHLPNVLMGPISTFGNHGGKSSKIDQREREESLYLQVSLMSRMCTFAVSFSLGPIHY